MHRQCVASLTAAVLLSAALGAWAAPPESASVYVPNSHGIGGACYLNSLGQLVSYRNPSITTSKVVALSGIATSTGWGRWATGGLCAHPRDYTMGVELDLLRLCGAGRQVCYGKGGAAGTVLLRAASGITIFPDEAAAVEALKTQIAAANPVQVHIDMYYTWDAVAAAYPSHDFGPAVHGSHSTVVNGYDAAFVYVTDSGPTYAPGETGENIPVPWSDFLSAWRETPNLTPIRAFWYGPYYMSYLTSDPVDIDDEWAIAWLGMDATRRVGDLVVGPDAFRYAAEGLRGGRTIYSVWPGLSPGVMTQSRAMALEFFEGAGRADIAALYEHSAELLASIFMNPDCLAVADTFDEVADTEEQAIALMQAAAAGVPAIVPLSPADGETLDLDAPVGFHWAALPGTIAPKLQLAMGGDFGDRTRTATVVPKSGNWFVAMAARDWQRVLKKDGGDRALRWRVISGGRAPSTSGERDASWDALAMTAVSPADAYAAAPGELVEFAFQAPPLALKPRIVISPANDFSDPRRLTYLAPGRGTSTAVFAKGTIALLLRKDDGDGVFYWRVEDSGAQITTVGPSESRSLTLP